MAAAAVCERVAAGAAAARSHLGEFAPGAAPARSRAVAHRRDCRPASPAPLRWETAAPCGGRREAEETRAWQQRWRARSASSKVPSVGEGEFEAEVLQSPVPVLVDFWATWCGPCKLMGLSVDWAAKQYEGKLKCVKIDLDANKTLAETYNVYGLPTIILFADGKEVPNTKREGALGMDKLQAYLEQKLPALAPTT